MSIFNLFKKDKQPNKPGTDNGVPGPTWLEGMTAHIQDPQKLLVHEWRRQLQTPGGLTSFQISFYGQLHSDHPNLITSTEFAPALIYAVDPNTGHAIVLFDGCVHGYNALFCDTFTNEQVQNRPPIDSYKDDDGNDTFTITISAYYGINYDDEFTDEVDANGLIELVNSNKMPFEEAKRNGFDALQIWVTNQHGKTVQIVSEELA